MIPLVPVVLGLLSVAGIGVDWWYSEQIAGSASQIESFLYAVEYGMSFEEFVTECWLFLALGAVSVWILTWFAIPRRRVSP
ncbi:MAG: hypothetical protein RBR71_13405 [Gudongella sp.]|nr:hypothetical protein [Gudongella sp.]